MRTLILILALLPIFATAQTLERNKIVAKETLVFSGGNPDTLKIAICQNSKGEFSWMYLSELQDSLNTGVYDTVIANYISIHRIRLRDSSLAANGNILSLGQDSTVTGCGITCDSLLSIADSVANSPWTLNLAGSIIQRILGNDVNVSGNLSQVYLYDTLGSVLGADPIFQALIGFDPITVYRLNDTLVSGNFAPNATLAITGSTGSIFNNWLGAGGAFITDASATVISNLIFTANVDASNATGSIVDNRFYSTAQVLLDSLSGIFLNNEGAGYPVNFSGCSDTVAYNRLNGRVTFTNSGASFESNIFEDGAAITSNNCQGNLSANKFYTGAHLYISDADSGASKSTFRYTIQVDADSNRGQLFYNDYTGGSEIYQPYINVRRDSGTHVIGCSFTVLDTVLLDPAVNYKGIWFTQQKVAINTTQAKAEAALDVNGTVIVRDTFTYSQGASVSYILTSDANGNATWQAPPVYSGDTLVTGVATAGSFTVPNNIGGVILSGTGTQSTYTVTLPSSPTEGQKILITMDGVHVTTLSFNGNGNSLSTTLSGGLNMPTDGQRWVTFHNGTWY